MRLAIDTFVLDSRFRNQGSYVYARKTIEGMIALAGNSQWNLKLLVGREGASDSYELPLREGVVRERVRALEDRRWWRLGRGLGTAVRHNDAELLFCPVPVNCSFVPVPTVVTVLDATPIKAPSQTWAKNAFERAILWSAAKHASRVITISENSKRDLVEAYGLAPERVVVTHCGFERNLFQPAREGEPVGTVAAQIGIHRPYIFHHGVVQPRKNLKRLIEAYCLMLARHPELDLGLVLAGPLGWRCDEVLEAANAGGAKGKVVLTGPVPNSDLADLIRGASLCVIPSLYEGFCLPLVECMACGAPTIASETSCLPEVSGGILRYFDPLSIEEMAETMTEVLSDRSLRRELAAKGLHWVSQFSWERCAGETLAVLVKAYEERTGKHCEELALV